MDITQAIDHVVNNKDLSRDEMKAVMMQLMTGELTQAQIGGFLIGLRMKGETVDEITAAVEVMRELSTKVTLDKSNLVDTCGTGGDGSNLFNVSTASAFVVAAAGGRVAKHGNRGASSASGSADVLEAAGVNLTLTPEQVIAAVDEIGVGFMFAQSHHGAMKHAIGPRREMKTRTIFNVLGPMTNPAAAPNQVIGVFNEAMTKVMAQVLQKLDSKHVLVLHAQDGLDEISIASDTFVCELKNGELKEYVIKPEDFGIKRRSIEGLQVEDAQQSLALIKGALGNEAGEQFDKARDVIALNSGAAIYAADLSMDLASGIEMAQDAIATGLALEKINDLAAFSKATEL